MSPAERAVRWLALQESRYVETGYGGLLGAAEQELASRINWPVVDRDEHGLSY